MTQFLSVSAPISLVYLQEFQTGAEAIAAERQVQGWSRKKKEALIKGNWESLVLLSKGKKNASIQPSPRLRRTCQTFTPELAEGSARTA